MSHPELTDIERDGTGELMNVGVGKAAAALGRLVRGEIELSVPRVLLVPLAEVMKYTPIAGDDAVIGVYAAFDGAFKGSIGFVVPASTRAQFLRLVMDQDFDADDAEDL
ncbi:MAG: hypothetical protein FJX47_21855, partial [Alphaproteobacteria bacterium]|nr:hypothetical protein [Alphaproteobacteria bacterium]